MMDDEILDAARQRQQLSVLYKQLVISLKFHHGETLQKMPQEMALKAMMEVWQSCNRRPRSQGDRKR